MVFGIVSSLIKALMLWVGLYVAVMHIMVAWKWSTPYEFQQLATTTTSSSSTPLPLLPDNEAIKQVEQEVITVYEYEVYDLYEDTIEILQNEVKTYESTLALVQKKREDLAHARERLIALMTSEELANATTSSSRSADVDGPDGDGGGMIFQGRADLSQFLRLVPLFKDKSWLTKYRSTGSLRQVFFRARRELQDSKRQVSRNWSDINRQLAAFHPNDTNANDTTSSWIDFSYLAPNCSNFATAPSNASSNGTAALLPTNATTIMTEQEQLELQQALYQRILQLSQQEIQRLLQGVETAIQERVDRDSADEWCIHSPSRYERLEDYYYELVANGSSVVREKITELNNTLHNITERVRVLNDSVIAQAAAEAAAALNESTALYSNMTNLTSCVQTSQVLAWIQAGLDAHYRKLDIRQALWEALEEDPKVDNASAIILDAILPFDDDLSIIKNDPAYLHHRRQSQLRSLLDTPLTKEAAKWIDTFVDLVGGYNDRVDHWMDAWYNYAAATVSVPGEGDSASSSMGHLTVQALLQAAGQVNEKYMSFAASHLNNS